MSDIIKKSEQTAALFKPDAEIRAVLKAIRNEIKTNKELAEYLASANESAMEDALITRFFDMYNEDILVEGVREFVKETMSIRSNPGVYIVDESTGRAVLKITKDMTYQPPNYIGEDGISHPSKPTLHPAISSGLAIQVYEASRIQKVMNEAPDQDKSAFDHIRDPDSIIRNAEERLVRMGIDLGIDGSYKEEKIEFGKENSAGLFESANLKFHRATVFSASLASKIKSLNIKRCSIVEIKRIEKSKVSYYEATVRYPALFV